MQAWRPHLRKDIDMLENVQKRFVKRIEGMSGKSYNNILIELNLFSLEYRQLRGDLIEVFKIIKGFENIDFAQFFSLSNVQHLRGHSLKLYKSSFCSDVGKYSFANRVVDVQLIQLIQLISTSFEIRLENLSN